MTGLPNLEPPPGDPVSVRSAAQRLEQTAAATTETAKRLGTANAEVGRVWESGAQRMFSILAGGWAEIAASAGFIMSRYAEAMSRYAMVLAASQSSVRQAQQRLQMLAASTPTGTPLDQAAVSAILTQARQASESAARAARELSSTASALIGPVDAGAGNPGSARDGHTSLVSRSHVASAGLTPSAAARRFDAQKAHLERQIGGVLNGLVGLASRPVAASHGPTGGMTTTNFGGTMTVGGTRTPTGATITVGGSQPVHSDATIMIPIRSPDPSSNPSLALAQAASDISKRSALRIWNRAFPGVPPPDTSAGGILRQILERGGDDLHPSIIEAVSTVHSGVAYGNWVLSLPHGYRPVRRFF